MATELGRVSECGEVEPFWRTVPLEKMSPEQWEALCDGCGRCCLLKLEDEDTGDIHLTKLACRLLDISSCRCRDYPNRHKVVSDCLSIDPDAVRRLSWLPVTCAYRRVAEGRELSWWHPLVSGNAETVHEAGISVRGWARGEDDVVTDDWTRFVIADFEEN